MLNGGHDCFWVLFPFVGHIGVQFEFVAIWVEYVQTVCDCVVASTNNAHAFLNKFLVCFLNIFRLISNFETYMIEARGGGVLFFRISPHFN